MTAELGKTLAVCLLAVLLIVLLRQYKSEYAVLISVFAGITVLLFLTERVLPAAEQLRVLFEKSGADAVYFRVAFKALGIAYLSGFVADTCRDCGQTALAAKAELAGKCAIFLLSVPLLTAVLQTALEFSGL